MRVVFQRNNLKHPNTNISIENRSLINLFQLLMVLIYHELRHGMQQNLHLIVRQELTQCSFTFVLNMYASTIQAYMTRVRVHSCMNMQRRNACNVQPSQLMYALQLTRIQTLRRSRYRYTNRYVNFLVVDGKTKFAFSSQKASKNRYFFVDKLTGNPINQNLC